MNKKIAEFIKKYGIACGGNWTEMFMTAIKNGLPDVYDSMSDKKEYSFEELFKIISENI
jgi:hypothetical protein